MYYYSLIKAPIIYISQLKPAERTEKFLKTSKLVLFMIPGGKFKISGGLRLRLRAAGYFETVASTAIP